MAHPPRVELDTFLDDALAGRLDRRQVMTRGAALGIGAPLLGMILGARPRRARAQDAAIINFASYNSDPVPREQTEQMVANFEAASGLDVELNTVNHEDFKQAIRTYLASDDPPDVLTWFAGNRMRFFSERGLAMDLTGLYEQEGWAESIPAGFIAASSASDGKPYFVPTTYYWWAVYYRPSIFAENGIEAVPETWDDFLSVIETLKGAGIIPITIGTNQPWTAAGWFDYLNMRTNGPEFHIQLMEGQQAYNSDQVKETFAHWRELLDLGAFIEQPESYLWQDAVTPLAQGEAAMYLMGQFIKDSYPDEGEGDLDFFRFPIINDVPIGEDAPTDGYFAAAGAKNVEGAMALLAYMGGQESQEGWAEEVGRIAVNRGVPLDMYAADVQKGIQMLQESDFVAQFYDRDTTPEMAERGMAAFIEFWNDPDAIDSILDGLEAERERIFGAVA